jgi:hypothetical protein
MYLMNKVFIEYLDKFVVVFIDNVFIFSKNEEEHDKYLCMVLQKLRENQLYAKLNKYEFCLKEVSFFGHIISEGGIYNDPSKVKDVLCWNTLQNVLDIRSFLSLAGYYRRFIEGFSKIFELMTDLLAKGKTFEWTPMCEASFQELKKKLTVDVVSSDICDEDQEKHDYGRSISRRNTLRFRLVQALSKSNSPMSSIVVLCCERICCPG